MTSAPRFIHLRVHTEYSLLEGAVRVKGLPGQAAAMGMPAVAITDTNNLFAALEFSVTAAKAGVQPILGLAEERGASIGGGICRGSGRGHAQHDFQSEQQQQHGKRQQPDFLQCFFHLHRPVPIQRRQNPRKTTGKMHDYFI